jgi:uncharacterized membrane protein
MTTFTLPKEKWRHPSTVLFITACPPGQRARAAGMVFTVLAIGASIGLTYIELNVIHAICYWCVASAVCPSCT